MSEEKPLIDSEMLRNIKETENKSEETKSALEAIELTSNIVDALMNGRQIDLSFYSLVVNDSIKKIRRAKNKK